MPSTRSVTNPHTIAILRALQLGDLLCSVPALRALRTAFPKARISLIGLPWAKAFAQRFDHYVDDFIEFPGYPGLPEQDTDFSRLASFLAHMRARRFDWLIQMQGDGSYVNDLVRLCEARETMGFALPSPDGGVPPGFLPYPSDCPEIHRHLRLMESIGAPPVGDHLEFPLKAQDYAEFSALREAASLQAGSFVCLHPGGRGLGRRWSAPGFVQVARGLVDRGLRLAVTGVAGERSLAEHVARSLPDSCVNLAGKTTLGSLAVVLSRARMLVANDTGVSHLAAALEIPSVILSVGSDPVRWNPLDSSRHRVLVGAGTESRDVLTQIDEIISNRPAVEPTRQDTAKRPLRILTWHVHGNYLFYLTHTPHDWFLPVGFDRPGYGGRAPGFPWSERVKDVPVAHLRRLAFDCILFQSRSAYLEDQFQLLTPEQRKVPKIYLEHDPPEDPTESRHIVSDPTMQLVHVTQFNRLMWDNGDTPAEVIEHGVPDPGDVRYTGELPRGLVVINDLPRRGRRVGGDLVARIRRTIPLDIIGMNSEAAGGLGEISHDALPRFMSRYRFFFHPVRYTSFGLAVCEAMRIGLPIVAWSVTEMPAVLQDGVSGYLGNDPDRLMQRMALLLADRDEARRLGEHARRAAQTRFSLERFVADWHRLLTTCASRRSLTQPVSRTADRTGEPSQSKGTPCAAKLH